MLELARASPSHVAWMHSHARPIDRTEWESSTGLPLRVQLRASLDLDDAVAQTLLNEEGIPLVMWGAHSLGEAGGIRVGQAWLIATTEAEQRVHDIHRHLKPQLAVIDALWDRTVAFTLTENHLHHAWMRRVGYVLEDSIEFGPKSTKYLIFIRHAEQDRCADHS